MIYIFIEWCIDNLNNHYNKEYLYYYRLYKKLTSLNKNLNLFHIPFSPYNMTSIERIIYQKNHLLTELPSNTILYPYSYCPMNHLHGVLELHIRANTIVYQCAKCNSIIIPRQ